MQGNFALLTGLLCSLAVIFYLIWQRQRARLQLVTDRETMLEVEPRAGVASTTPFLSWYLQGQGKRGGEDVATGRALAEIVAGAVEGPVVGVEESPEAFLNSEVPVSEGLEARAAESLAPIEEETVPVPVSGEGRSEGFSPLEPDAVASVLPSEDTPGSLGDPWVEELAREVKAREPPGAERNGEVSLPNEGTLSQNFGGGNEMNDPLLKVQVVVGESVKQILEETVVTLPLAAIKVRNIVATITEITTEVITDKVVVQGILHKQIFFVGTDNIVHHLAEDVPFSTFLDVPGALPGMNVQVRPVIEHVLFRLLTPTTLLQKVIINLNVVVTETRQVNIATGTGPLIKVEQVVGENTSQTMEETTVTLANPAIKISEIRATIVDVVAEVIADKVIVQGVIHKQIFYVGTDNIEYHQAEDVPFSHFVDVPGALSDMNVQVHPMVEHVGFNLLDPTTLHEKVVVEIFVKVTQTVQLNVALGTGPLIQAEAVRGENTAQFMEETTVALANPAIKVREIVATITNLTAEVITDKVIIQGTIHKQIFYVGTDNLEYHQFEDVPFSQFVDVMGAAPGMNVQVHPTIEHVIFNLLSDVLLEQKVVLELFVKVTDPIIIRVQELPGPYGPVFV